jgi:hypothetical protein
MVRGPNFFVAGAAKSGTTALYHGLKQHPDVFLPDLKEPHVYAYIADPYIAGHLFPDEAAARRRYAELYQHVNGATAVGDASTTNLVVPGAAEAIAGDVPEARIVVVLRQPVDRAYSHWRHFRAAGGDDIADFAEALRQEETRAVEGWPITYQYMRWGRYCDQLGPYFHRFGRDRVLVHLYDDLSTDAEAVLRATFRFLEIDESVKLSPLGRYNELPYDPPPAPPLLSRRRLRAALAKRPPPLRQLDADLRSELTAGIREEIDRLEVLLGRDLVVWR